LIVLLVAGTTLLGLTTAMAQTRGEGPWWPHPKWGPEDQAGASNWITPAKILEAARLIKTGEAFELGHVYERGMPMFGARTYAMFIPGSPTYPSMGKNALVGHDDFLCAEIGNVGTQFDGLGHVGTRLTMADGSVRDVFYNGVPVEEMRDAYGLKKLGVERLRPIITRGVLVDLAGYKGVETLPNSYEVSVEDVRGALRRQGMSEAQLRDGDALLLRYGWERLWTDPAKYNHNPPGIGLAVARWLAARNVSMVGSDSWTTEVVPNPDPELAFPVHQELLVKNGIFNLENMALDKLAAAGAYEFAFLFTPVPFKGAAGSPGRPLAIR
jgi:kynurenine formamidase